MTILCGVCYIMPRLSRPGSGRHTGPRRARRRHVPPPVQDTMPGASLAVPDRVRMCVALRHTSVIKPRPCHSRAPPPNAPSPERHPPRAPPEQHLRPIHRPPDRHLAAGARHPVVRRARLQLAPRLRPARGGLPHHPGHHPAPRRRPGNRRDPDHRLPGTPVRPDPRPGHDDLVIAPRAPARSPCNSTSAAAWIPPPRTCRPRSTPRPAPCRSTCPTRRSTAKVNPADAPILTIALTSDLLPIAAVTDAADTLLQPKLSEIDGVGRVTVQGGMRPAVRVRVDPARLAAYGLAMEDVRTAVAAANANGAEGRLRRPPPGLRPRRQRPACRCRRLQEPGRRLAQRRAGAAVRGGQRDRRGGERPRRRALERHAGGGAGHPAPARRQHRADRAGASSRRCRGCNRRSRPASA